MATRAQIVAAFARRRMKSYYLPNFTRAQVKQAAQALTNAEWDDIIEGIRGNQHGNVGLVLNRRVQAYLYDLAAADIEARLGADDTLTIAELEDLF